MDTDEPRLTVVGVVGRIKQDAPRFGFVAEPRTLTAAVRRTIADLDSSLPMYRVQMMAEGVDSSLAERRFSMLLRA